MLGSTEMSSFDGSPLVTVRGRLTLEGRENCSCVCMSLPSVTGDKYNVGVRIFTGNCWRIAGVVKPAGCVKESNASPDDFPVIWTDDPLSATATTSGFAFKIETAG